MLEIERTFLVNNIPFSLSGFKFHKIKQGYILTGDSILRIRSKGNKNELTKKSRVNSFDASIQTEETIYLTNEEFDKFWKLVDVFLEKTRYEVPLKDGLVAELDVFEGKLSGLIVVDVEFKNEEEMNKFVPEKWFGRDITQEEFAANNFLAGKSFEDIKKYL